MYSAISIIGLLALHTTFAALQAVLLGIMTLRTVYRRYPVFYVYTAYEVFRSAAVYWTLYFLALHKISYATYFTWYWATEPVGAALIFWIVYRVFGEVFDGYTTLQRVGQTVLLITVAVLLVVAIFMAKSAHGSFDGPILSAALLLERSSELMVCGLLMTLFAATRYLRLAWRSRGLGIALGFGLNSAIDMATTTLRVMVGQRFNLLLSWIAPISYGLAVITWVVYFSRSERLSIAANLPLADQATEWNSAVTELLTQ